MTDDAPIVSQAAADQAVEQIREAHTHSFYQDTYNLRINCSCRHWHQDGGRWPDKPAMIRQHLEHLAKVVQHEGPELAVLIDRTIRLPANLIHPETTDTRSTT